MLACVCVCVLGVEVGGGEGGGGWKGANAVSQTTLLHMKWLYKTESPIFVFSVFSVSKGNILDFYLFTNLLPK